MSVFPTTADNIYSAFHIRDDVRKFLQVRSQEDVGISHDWPRGIELCGDHEKLSRKKQGPREDCNIGKLGSIAAQKVLGQLRPAYWLSSHLHTKYAAIVEHETRAMKNSTPIDDIGALQKDKKVVDAEEVEDNTSVTIEFYSPNVTVHCLRPTTPPRSLCPLSYTSGLLSPFNQRHHCGFRNFTLLQRHRMWFTLCRVPATEK